MSVSLSGYEDKVVTLIAASGVKKGDLVKISANKTVENVQILTHFVA